MPGLSIAVGPPSGQFFEVKVPADAKPGQAMLVPVPSWEGTWFSANIENLGPDEFKLGGWDGLGWMVGFMNQLKMKGQCQNTLSPFWKALQNWSNKQVLYLLSVVEADSTLCGSNSRSGTKMAKEINESLHDAERWMVKTLHVLLWDVLDEIWNSALTRTHQLCRASWIDCNLDSRSAWSFPCGFQGMRISSARKPPDNLPGEQSQQKDTVVLWTCRVYFGDPNAMACYNLYITQDVAHVYNINIDLSNEMLYSYPCWSWIIVVGFLVQLLAVLAQTFACKPLGSPLGCPCSLSQTQQISGSIESWTGPIWCKLSWGKLLWILLNMSWISVGGNSSIFEIFTP